MKEIKLSKGQTAFVDEEDFGLVNQHSWSAFQGTSGIWYAVRTMPKGHKPSRLLMHRVVLGAKKGEIVDHKNRNGLVNTRDNLRLCTQGQNSGNRRMKVTNTTGFKGVYFDKARNKWTAVIGFGSRTFLGKQTYLGRFKTKEEAATAYDSAATKLYGEFALTNKALGLL